MSTIFSTKLEYFLKQEQNEHLTERRKVYIRDLCLHKVEVERIAAEDCSPHKAFSVLKNRYLLLTLLGKGGYGEVHKVSIHLYIKF